MVRFQFPESVLLVLLTTSTVVTGTNHKFQRTVRTNNTTNHHTNLRTSATSLSSTPTTTPSPRRVWITYEEDDRHDTVLSTMNLYRNSINSNMETIYDFPSMKSIVTMASDEEITALLANTTIGNIKITDDPIRYPMAKPQRMMQDGQGSQVPSYGIALTQVDLLKAYTGLNGNGITVCVIDSGLDVTHYDISTSSYTGDSLVSGTEWTTDTSGHGTHVTGIISATDNTLGVVGVAPGVSIHTIDVFGDYGFAYASALIDAGYKCRDAGAKIISMSLGGDFYLEEENSLFTDLYINDGILSVAAAGNYGDGYYSYPASYDNVLSVGAIDENKQLAFFSQYNNRVDLVAPGVGIFSTLPLSSDCEICTELGQYEYGYLDGTSQATPFVSGIAALLWSSDITLSVDAIKSALLYSAEDLGDIGKDDYYGYGLVAADDAYNLLHSSTLPPITDSPVNDLSQYESCSQVTLVLQTDMYPSETSIQLTDMDSGIDIWSGGAYFANTTYTITSDCVSPTGCYKFTISDGASDGLCCEYGYGYFDLYFDSELIHYGDAFGSTSIYYFGSGCF